MKITEEVQNRLLEVVNKCKLNKIEFHDSKNFLSSLKSDIQNGKVKSLTGPMVVLFEIIYSINAVWLKTGNGPKHRKTMMTSDAEETQIIIQFRKLNKDSRSLLRTIVKTLAAAQDELEKTKKPKGGSPAKTKKKTEKKAETKQV